MTRRVLYAVVVAALSASAVGGVAELGHRAVRGHAQDAVDASAQTLSVALRDYVERASALGFFVCGTSIDSGRLAMLHGLGVAVVARRDSSGHTFDLTRAAGTPAHIEAAPFLNEGVIVDGRDAPVLVVETSCHPETDDVVVIGYDTGELRRRMSDLAPSWFEPSDAIRDYRGRPVILRTAATIPSVHQGTRATWELVGLGPAPEPESRLRRWIIALLVGIVIGAISFSSSRRAQPDRALEAAARRVGEGDLDVTLDGNNPTASAFNRMTRELKDARGRLARAERIAAWRDIARRIAHEIKNPLTPIKMAMETVRKTHARKHPDFDEIFEESTKTVLEETARLEKIVTEFSRFARMPRPKAESMDVREIAERVVAMHDLAPANATVPEGAKGARVELRAPEKQLPSVRADREQLTQVLVNLVQNAADAAREKRGETGGRVIVSLAETEHGGVRIVVGDNGPGIPADARMAVLEPYYTTKSHGTGLGLAIVDRIVSDHGGTLSIGDDAELGGAAITIELRREGPSEEPESSVGV